MFISDSQHPPRSRHAVYLGVDVLETSCSNSVDSDQTAPVGAA